MLYAGAAAPPSAAIEIRKEIPEARISKKIEIKSKRGQKQVVDLEEKCPDINIVPEKRSSETGGERRGGQRLDHGRKNQE